MSSEADAPPEEMTTSKVNAPLQSKGGCVACGSNDLKKNYKCPRCRFPYCSLACAKEHKAACSKDVAPHKKDEALPSVEVQPLRARKRQRSTTAADKIDEVAEEQGWVLPVEKLAALRSSTAVQEALAGNRKLLKALIDINDGPDRERALASALKDRSLGLEAFLQTTLRAVGVYDQGPDGREYLRS